MSYQDPIKNKRALDQLESNRWLWIVFWAVGVVILLALITYTILEQSDDESENAAVISTPTVANAVEAESSATVSVDSTGGADAGKEAVLAQMEASFEGNPSSEDIQALLDPLLAKLELASTTENYSLAATTLTGFRQQAQSEVTEMEMLQWLATFEPPAQMQLVEAIQMAWSELSSA